ncbi:enoyl-CoA hydratase/isomerase [Drechmeria coniospora]|uniref:Enoyl-CoA hydratase/isomerase n=1 Tax=Drechmeria coniospora TaxID=98403 RepID=A0A151GWF2_DRECN|nr:enoyl-CoA hydratase/isomerase [Drechmeria coniospora]KYK61424.1 enoyl-CoA hydratase/isomerase [Drechmeria coniospora]ODA81187.1 hypothetical protein RJ55_04151 [Drechmeria coniospora]
MADGDECSVSKSPDGITTVTLNRPERKNAVDPATAMKLAAAFADFEADDGQKVCILHGAHGTFCAGFDLHALAGTSVSQGRGGQDHRREPEARPKLDAYVVDAEAHGRGKNAAPMGPSRMQLSKPVIGAVSGHAVAGGLELALLADVRVAEDDAIFGVFCRRWGVPLLDGGTVRLQAVVGLGRAMDMILTGRPVSAAEALQMGLVNRVVRRGAALEEATKIARQLLAFPQACMKADRASCYYAAYDAVSFEDAMRNEFTRGVGVVAEESVAGAGRFSRGAGRHGTFADSKL